MKSNIKLLIIAMATLSMGVMTGCKRGDDFFISPNNPSKVTPALLLTAIEVSTYNSYEGMLVKNASVLVQQNAGVDGQMLPINNYLLAENEFDNQWGQNYQALFSCKQLQDQFGAANPYYSGIADVLAAMNWGIVSDLWGDIPFSEALQGQDNYTAKYDGQEQVFKGIIALLDDAITKLSMNASANELLPGADDITFGGDVTLWTKTAYALKARYLNRLSNKASYSPSDILASLQKGMQSSGDDFITKHGDAATERNQWYDFQQGRANYALASQPFVDSIKLRPTDKRLTAYFNTFDTTGQVIGSPIATPSSEASDWGPYLAGGNTTGVRLISFTEAKFIEAEVKARQGDAPGAAAALNAAIKESCSTVTNGAYDGADIAIYTAANVDLSRVIYEKWIAMFGSVEPYNDYRKTGFPKLVVNPNGRLPVIPTRFPTPQAERVSNPNAPVPTLTTPVWFAQN
ncbi:SusD/RagB family nutrient-binding outer membrane lipoprotein [Taibaiella chishuiensis]|uniref:SusD-like starch-binding protein associating with outer membrane n=1 Tax=Taibaiella chishuiensis TaxID=1434707 RepID=A0A2P8DD92_9BACT|nr:SusD/RagB family nutrient-binding outer membrane lipoprotein [Taibaiella chishuiensis]PSK95188.1 SusD-like starch-binding protein associating with outer membrane [Taibaiella chishuiensis]